MPRIDDNECDAEEHGADGRKSSPLDKPFPMYGKTRLIRPGSGEPDLIWDAVREEARLEADKEPLLSSILNASILSHECLELALAFVLANGLQNPTLLATQLLDIFREIMLTDSAIRLSIRLDLQAFKDGDPSCSSYIPAFLHYKGYLGLESYRVAHALWRRGRIVLALALQSRVSEVFGIDIHPAARIGDGVVMDHGTGVVIGETATIGNHVSLMHGVTLGGTGKGTGDRHPKIRDGVSLGARVTVLGNITIGEGAIVVAASLVLTDIPPFCTAAGNPAQVIESVRKRE